MKSITINCENIITNKFFLATVGGIIGVIFLFLDKCIFIKNVPYISYIKLFILIFIIVFSILYFIEKIDINTSDISEDLNTERPTF